MGARAGLAVRAVAAGVLVSVGIAGCSAATGGQAARPSASTPNADGPGSGTSPAPPVTVYVIADNAVVAIRAATGARSREIPAGAVPYAVAVTPDGKTAYVPVTVGGYEMVIPIDTAANTAGQPIRIGASDAGGCDTDVIAITPDGKTAYVTNYSDGTVVPISTATNTAGSPIRTGPGPSYIAITPDGKTAYVSNQGSGTVTPIQVATNTPGPPIKIGKPINPIESGCDTEVTAITPDGKTAYVTSYNDGTVVPISTATNTAGPPIRTGKYPSYIAITPDGKAAYVSNKGSGTVTPINTATNIPGTPIPVGPNPGPIAIAP